MPAFRAPECVPLICLAAARRVTDHTAEVATVEAGIFVCQHVRFHVSKGGLRLVFYALVEGLQDILFEMGRLRRGSELEAVR